MQTVDGKDFGEVVHKDESAVVRIKKSTNRKGEVELHVTINRIVNGEERLPTAYLLGSDCLIWKVPA